MEPPPDALDLVAQERSLEPQPAREPGAAHRGRDLVLGRVVDEHGRPVENALVFFGAQEHHFEDPFRRTRWDDVPDGTRSGVDGRFELHGLGERITAAHAAFSPITVEVARAALITLPARGAIQGWLLDRDGRPLESIELGLDGSMQDRDESPHATTGAGGRFLFEGVEAGAHMIWSVQDGFLLGVRVTAGSLVETEVRVGGGLPVELDLSALAPDEARDFQGLFLGLGQTFGLAGAEHGKVNPVLLPGPYWLVTDHGLATRVQVTEADPRVRVEIGGAVLVVHAPPGSAPRPVQAVPCDSDDFVRQMSVRAGQRLQPEAPARFRLHPGCYVLVGRAGVVLREVDVPPQGAEVLLP